MAAESNQQTVHDRSRTHAKMTSVVVVEDEPAVRHGVATWLGQRGFSVVTASNLGSAFSAAVKHRPDVILLDVKLGAENGLQLIGMLRGVGLEIPCVVHTAHAGPYDGFKARELGVADLIEKPSSADQIASALRYAVIGAGQNGRGLSVTDRKSYSFRISPLHVRLPDQPLSHRMRNAIDYIEAKFTDVNLSAEDVADHIGVTPAHLSRMFDQSLGKSPSTVINELRIRRAQQLLTDPRLSLGEIANLCGYRTTRQLNGWFELFCGEPPALRRLDSRTPRPAEDQEIDMNIK